MDLLEQANDSQSDEDNLGEEVPVVEDQRQAGAAATGGGAYTAAAGSALAAARRFSKSSSQAEWEADDVWAGMAAAPGRGQAQVQRPTIAFQGACNCSDDDDECGVCSSPTP